MTETTWIPVFRAGRQAQKVRMLGFSSWIVALACMYFAVLRIGHSEPREMLWGVLVGGLGVSACVGMEVYRRFYVTRMDVSTPLHDVRITTMRWGRPVYTHVKRDEILPSTLHTGAWAARGMRGNAPWISVRLTSRRLPFILDVQGEILHPALLSEVLREPWIYHLTPS